MNTNNTDAEICIDLRKALPPLDLYRWLLGLEEGEELKGSLD